MLYKIVRREGTGEEINPVGEFVNFESVGYTNDPEVANWYKDRPFTISVEEVETQE